MRIAVLEDDPDRVAIYNLLLSSAHHECVSFGTVGEFLQGIEHEHFDLFILDWMLPDGTAERPLKWIRDNLGWDIPVICVTSRQRESDVVNVLRMGADDYFVKSSKHFELLARIESLARRSRRAQADILHFELYEINQSSREISVRGKKIDLTQKDFELACYLFNHPGKLLAREDLLEKIWGIDAEIDTRTVDTHISRIRHKLDIYPKNGWEIVTVYGYGYRLQHAENASPA